MSHPSVAPGSSRCESVASLDPPTLPVMCRAYVVSAARTVFAGAVKVSVTSPPGKLSGGVRSVHVEVGASFASTEHTETSISPPPLAKKSS